jgi:tRNA A37 threonylcarbamoyladenosine dehydratase
MTVEVDFSRRFGGVARLYGAAGLEKLQQSHCVVVGIGGVGSWAAEALARNAVGKITLVDLDNIAESNFNRQLHAIDGNVGKAKITAMRERILHINPACQVQEIEDFVSPTNIQTLLNFSFDGLLDCIDQAEAKAALAAFCQNHKTPFVMAGGAGGRLDPTKIQVADLSQVNNDKLLAKVRTLLRSSYAYPKGNSNPKKTQKMHLTCVFSDEVAQKPETACATDAISGLNCAGYGSSVCVTAPMGFALVAQLIEQLLSA